MAMGMAMANGIGEAIANGHWQWQWQLQWEWALAIGEWAIAMAWHGHWRLHAMAMSCNGIGSLGAMAPLANGQLANWRIWAIAQRRQGQRGSVPTGNVQRAISSYRPRCDVPKCPSAMSTCREFQLAVFGKEPVL